MIKECKKCGSKNLYLEPRIKGQDVMTADMVALKCKDCGFWLKWCPKDERKFYLKQPKDKWQKLKEWILDVWKQDLSKELSNGSKYSTKHLIHPEKLLYKIQELEGEDD